MFRAPTETLRLQVGVELSTAVNPCCSAEFGQSLRQEAPLINLANPPMQGVSMEGDESCFARACANTKAFAP